MKSVTIKNDDRKVIIDKLTAHFNEIGRTNGFQVVNFKVLTNGRPVHIQAFWHDELFQYVPLIAQQNSHRVGVTI